MTNDLPYDFEDFGMTKEELIAKHGDEKGHEYYTRTMWLTDSDPNANPMGYWDWVVAQIKVDDDELPSNVKSDNDDTSDIKPIADLNEFVSHLTAWHQNRVQRIEQMLEIPEGAKASLNDGEMVELSGDALTAFKIGLTTALSELGSLPFVIETDTNDLATPDNSIDLLVPDA